MLKSSSIVIVNYANNCQMYHMFVQQIW